MLAEIGDVVIGVDTHRDLHALALVERASGLLLAEAEIGADRAGYRKALRLARSRAGGRVWAIEGCGCYGAGVARFLVARGERVVEVDGARPRTLMGKRRRLRVT